MATSPLVTNKSVACQRALNVSLIRVINFKPLEHYVLPLIISRNEHGPAVKRARYVVSFDRSLKQAVQIGRDK
jgi:hypothetical protein